jgi:uncharacterized protein (DUF4213/DUF364 family)
MTKKNADTPKGESKKRHFESKFDEKVLRDMINAGKSADEIQAALGIVSKQSLRQHVLKLITRDRKVYEVPGLYVRNLKRPMVNFKGEIRLTKNMLDCPGSTYAPNDQFEIEVDNDRIVLTRIKDETATEANEPESPEGL